MFSRVSIVNQKRQNILKIIPRLNFAEISIRWKYLVARNTFNWIKNVQHNRFYHKPFVRFFGFFSPFFLQYKEKYNGNQKKPSSAPTRQNYQKLPLLMLIIKTINIIWLINCWKFNCYYCPFIYLFIFLHLLFPGPNTLLRYQSKKI